MTFLFIFPLKKYVSSQKTCCTHPLRRRRGGTRRNVLSRVPTLTLWMWNVQVSFFFFLVDFRSQWSAISTHPLGLKRQMSVSQMLFCPFFRLLQDHNSVQPCSDSCAVCWLFNGPVSAYWRQSTSHRGSVLKKICLQITNVYNWMPRVFLIQVCSVFEFICGFAVNAFNLTWVILSSDMQTFVVLLDFHDQCDLGVSNKMFESVMAAFKISGCTVKWLDCLYRGLPISFQCQSDLGLQKGWAKLMASPFRRPRTKNCGYYPVQLSFAVRPSATAGVKYTGSASHADGKATLVSALLDNGVHSQQDSLTVFFCLLVWPSLSLLAGCSFRRKQH